MRQNPHFQHFQAMFLYSIRGFMFCATFASLAIRSLLSPAQSTDTSSTRAKLLRFLL
jgi:hypothetical protein